MEATADHLDMAAEILLQQEVTMEDVSYPKGQPAKAYEGSRQRY